MPVKETDCGLPPALSATVTAALRLPFAEGVNVMLRVQFAPAASVPPVWGQVVPEARAKSPLFVPVMAMLVMFSGSDPLLVSVKLCAALVVPTV